EAQYCGVHVLVAGDPDAGVHPVGGLGAAPLTLCGGLPVDVPRRLRVGDVGDVLPRHPGVLRVVGAVVGADADCELDAAGGVVDSHLVGGVEPAGERLVDLVGECVGV